MKVLLFLSLLLASSAAYAGQTQLLNSTGTVSASGNTTVVSAVTRKRIMVSSFSLTTRSTNTVSATFQSGTSGSGLWSVELISPATSTLVGANLAVPHKQGAIFGTLHGGLLNLNLSAAPTQTVTYSVGYYEED